MIEEGSRVETAPNILLLGHCAQLQRLLDRTGYAVQAVSDPGLALAQGTLSSADVTLLDLDGIPSDAGLKVCERLTTAWPDTPVVIVSHPTGLESAVGAIRSGAYDFLCKPLDVAAVERAVTRALAHRSLRSKLQSLTTAVEQVCEADGFVGYSPAMRAMYAEITKAARAHTSVLIRGESGTGKELVARAIHQRTDRRSAPFVAINCAAVPAPLLESELFGHVAGAFTGARTARDGVFVRADGGTLLLDELGDMPPEMQAKLLRVLQEHRVRPVGGESSRTFDVRVLASTHCDLAALVADGRFREDLYYRINGVQVLVPPLRNRGSDALRLAEHYLIVTSTRFDRPTKRISPDCARALLHYSWPGNVRELQNVVERAVALSCSPELELDDLPKHIAAVAETPVSDAEELAIPGLGELRLLYINHVIEAVGGNRTRAAEILQLNRRTLYRYLERAADSRAKEDRAR